MQQQLIQDPYFRVNICLNGSSPAPDKSIWKAQHVCVSENYAFDATPPANPADAVIRHQLKVKHWSVLEFGYVVLHFEGFPHDTVMQLVRHQDSKPLVQSMRYTGERMIELTKEELWVNAWSQVERLFYVKPAGRYSTRTGTYEVTAEQREKVLRNCYLSAIDYHDLVKDGWPEEDARRVLRGSYRQNFTMAGTLRAVMHWLDQRTLADTQIEAQTLAAMALKELKDWSPEFFGWYEDNRAGKNMLAP